jgi:DNA-binding MarR family transcriptional regulator
MSVEFDLLDYVPYRVAAVSNLLAFDRDPDIQEVADLALREFRTLMDIGATGPLKAADIARQSRMSTSTVSRAVSQLQKDGYVESVEDPVDLRGPHLKLTGKGEEVYDRLVEICRERSRLIERTLTKQDRKKLVDMLLKLEVMAESLLADHAEGAAMHGKRLSRDQRDLIRWARGRQG